MEIIYRHVARAVILYKGKILVAQLKGAHSFLPGGGVEIGDTCEETIKRELFEELGLKEINVKNFIGVMEDSFEENEQIQHSISHVFEVEVEESELRGLYPNAISKEDHLRFYWISPTKEELSLHNVLSRAVPELVSEYFIDRKPRFYTDMQHKELQNAF